MVCRNIKITHAIPKFVRKCLSYVYCIMDFIDVNVCHVFNVLYKRKCMSYT